MDELPLNALDFSFDTSSLIAGLIFGIVGLWVFRRGRKNANLRHVATGLLLMIYPYFVSGRWLNWGIGLLLCGYTYYTWYE